MPALFRRRTLNPRVVPTVPVEIDGTHPLATNLIGLYIPSRGGTDLCGNGPPIFPQAGTTFASTGIGTGISSLAAASGMASTVNPTRFERVGTNLGLVHVGWHTSTTASATSEMCVFGIMFTGATYFPFAITLNNNTFHFATNTGANFATYACGFSPTVGLNVVAISNNTGGGNLWTYKNGVNGVAGGNTGTGNVNWAGGTSPHIDMSANLFNTALYLNCIHLAGMVYDWGASQIPANTAAWLGVEPFAMLRPIVRRSFVSVPTGLPPVTGTLSVTQANQTVSATGAVQVSGALSATQAAQTLVASAGPVAGASLATTQAAQTLSGQASVIPVVAGSLAVTQASQTLSAAAVAMPFGALAVTQASQTLSAAGRVSTSGTLTLTQAAQTLVATGSVPVDAILSLVQADQTLSAHGGPHSDGTVLVEQADQTLVANGTVGISSDAIHIVLSPPVIPLVDVPVVSDALAPVDVVVAASSAPSINVHVVP